MNILMIKPKSQLHDLNLKYERWIVKVKTKSQNLLTFTFYESHANDLAIWKRKRAWPNAVVMIA